VGQTVIIRDHVVMGEVLLVTTDRSFTGQDGQAITPASPGDAVPQLLAEDLFDLDLGVDHVYVLQNTVTIRRGDPWDQAAIDRCLEVISAFLRHYEGSEEEEE
jgi:hypothetical protein